MSTDVKEFEEFLDCLPKNLDPWFIPVRNDKSPDVKKNDSAKNEKYRLSHKEAKERIKNGKNVGVYLRDDFAVMDIDNPEKALEYIPEDEPQKTLTIKSRSGKPHIYYQKGNGGIEGRDIPGIIELRTGWRYVLVPGSYAYDKTEFHETGEKNWGVYRVKNKNPIKTLKPQKLPERLQPRTSKKKKPTHNSSEHKNTHNWSLKKIRNRDKKLDVLLKKILPTKKDQEDCDFPSRSEADLSTVNKLLFWEFSEDNIKDILQTYRRYEKTERTDYLERTLKKAQEKSFKTISDSVEPACWNPSEGDFYEKDNKFIPKLLAEDIMKDHHFATHIDSKTIYVYKDGIYEPRGEQKIESEAQKRLGGKARNNKIRETIGQIQRKTHAYPKKFVGPKNKIACENGLLNVETRELKEFTPKKILLSKIPVKYDPNADCPKIKEFINDIVEEEDKKLLQELTGYCLYKGYPLAKAFMLLGNGANGKSTFLNLITRLIGKNNVAAPSLQEILSNRFKKIELFGKLANIHADLSTGELQDTGTFKMLTGGDKIIGEKKRKDPIEFYNHAKLIYSANELPKTTDRTLAFFRRWIIIDFPNQFSEDDPNTDPQILEKITTKKEMSGFLNWALDGLERILNNNHFSKTKNREDIEKEWIRQTDSLRAFLNDCIEVKQDHKITKEFLYLTYKAYCAKHNLYTMKKGPVTKALPSKIPQTELYKPEIDGAQIRCWRDLDLEKGVLHKDFVVEVHNKIMNDEDRQDRQCFSSYWDYQENNINNNVNKEGDKHGSILSIIGDSDDEALKSESVSELKQQTLALLKQGMALHVSEIADELGASDDRVREALDGLWGEGCVTKNSDDDGVIFGFDFESGEEVD